MSKTFEKWFWTLNAMDNTLWHELSDISDGISEKNAERYDKTLQSGLLSITEQKCCLSQYIEYLSTSWTEKVVVFLHEIILDHKMKNYVRILCFIHIFSSLDLQSTDLKEEDVFWEREMCAIVMKIHARVFWEKTLNQRNEKFRKFYFFAFCFGFTVFPCWYSP